MSSEANDVPVMTSKACLERDEHTFIVGYSRSWTEE